MEQYITYTSRKKPASSASAVHAQAPAIAHLQAPALVLAQSQATAHKPAKITNRKTATVKAQHRKTATAVAETNNKPYISSNYIINYAKRRGCNQLTIASFFLREGAGHQIGAIVVRCIQSTRARKGSDDMRLLHMRFLLMN